MFLLSIDTIENEEWRLLIITFTYIVYKHDMQNEYNNGAKYIFADIDSFPIASFSEMLINM